MAATALHSGGCLCGRVRYAVDSPIQSLVLCHCSRCRKATGSAFAAVTLLAADAFHITDGSDAVGDFTVAGVHRLFCRHCGSPIISKRDAVPEIVRLRVGTLDTPLEDIDGAHIFVASKAPWFDIHDEWPQHAERLA